MASREGQTSHGNAAARASYMPVAYQLQAHKMPDTCRSHASHGGVVRSARRTQRHRGCNCAKMTRAAGACAAARRAATDTSLPGSRGGSCRLRGECRTWEHVASGGKAALASTRTTLLAPHSMHPNLHHAPRVSRHPPLVTLVTPHTPSPERRTRRAPRSNLSRSSLARSLPSY